MKTHFAKVTTRKNGATRTSTLCNRLSNRCADGINSTTDKRQVDCKLCLDLLNGDTQPLRPNTHYPER